MQYKYVAPLNKVHTNAVQTLQGVWSMARVLGLPPEYYYTSHIPNNPQFPFTLSISHNKEGKEYRRTLARVHGARVQYNDSQCRR